MTRFITSESVTEGHPDKICDMIADSILDKCLIGDPLSRVAVESIVKSDKIVVFGEITSKARFSIPQIARGVILDIGYTKKSYGQDPKKCEVFEYISRQSSDISQGVTGGQGLLKEKGAGDQGMMYGYACLETQELMPLPITLSQKIAYRMADVRKKGKIGYLRPDGKTQVTVEYENDKPKRISVIVLSCQTEDGIDHEQIEKDVRKEILEPVCDNLLDKNTIYFINPTGRFVIGGPFADSGLTGKKTQVDTYGSVARHGGGSFSGKDPTKVDRSATYMARYIAKSFVANNICEKCEVCLAYAIGVADPVSISVDTFGTSKLKEEELIKILKNNFPVRPQDIIDELDLRKPVYKKTAVYGHFGRPCFTWEKIKKINF